jgi:fatty-acyl-CoA synthase
MTTRANLDPQVSGRPQAGLPRAVAPTLPEAVRRLSHYTDRGFTFIGADGKERFVPFKEMYEDASRRGAHLLARGLKKGERVAMVIPDGDEFVLTFLGATFAGLVPVPIYPQLSFKNVETYHDTLAHIANASKASLLVTTQGTKQYVEPIVPRVATLGGRLATVDELHGAAPALDAKVEPEDLCFLQFTSGSTSRPKGVVVTHGNLAHNCEAFMIQGLGRRFEDRAVSWLPLFHDMGLIGFVMGPIFTDIQSWFLPTASFIRNPRVWTDTINRVRGTITWAPNFAYALIAKRLKDKDVQGLDLSCMRITGIGAEPIQGKTLREFTEKLAPAKFDPKSFLPSYGMAEATLAISFAKHGTGFHTDVIDKKTLEKGEAKPCKAEGEADGAPVWQELVSCGYAFDDHAFKVVDEAGKEAGERQVGQIITRGPSITQGYFEEPEKTAESFKDGWLYTGDLGYVAGGELYICGRLKDMVIIRGRNFYPNDIEWIVGDLPGVRRGNVVAFSAEFDAHGKVAAMGTGEEQLVVVAEGFSGEAERLKAEIASAVTAHFNLAAHDVVIVPQGSIPRTSSGKPQRRKSRQMYVDGAFAKMQKAPSASADAGA